MSDESDKKEDGFELDWDDALDDWEKDVEKGAVAKSGPMPQTPAKPAAPPARALYQPPDASEIARMRGARGAPPPVAPPAAAPRTSMPTAPPPAIHGSFADDDDDDDGTTKVGAIPRELMDRASDRERRGREPTVSIRTENEPAPRATKPESPISAVDLDLDGLLDGLDSDTNLYPAEVPRVTHPVRTPSAPPAAIGPSPTVPPAVAAPAPAPQIPAALKLPDSQKSDPGKSAATELARALARAQPKTSTPGVRPAPAIPRPGAPALPAAPGGKPPLVAPPGGAARPPLGAIPKPGAAPSVPKPAAPPPSAPEPTVAAAADELDDLLAGLDPVASAPPAAPASGPIAAPAMPAPAVPAPAMPAPAAVAPPAPAAVAPPAPAAVAPPAPVSSDEDDGLPALEAPPIVAESAAEDAFFAVTEAKATPPRRALDDELADLALDDSPPAPASAPAPSDAAEDEPVSFVGGDDDAESVVVGSASEDVEGETYVVSGDDDEPEADGPPPADAERVSAPPPLPSRRSAPPSEAAASEAAPNEAAPNEAAPSEATPKVAAPNEAAPAPAARGTVDRGAQAARRSVRSRKPRRELFPLVGKDENARRAQIDLLSRLAEKARGVSAARLFTTIAELAETIGDGATAGRARERARASAPNDILVLRAARRAAQQRADWPEVRATLRAEAELPGANAALTLSALAELELGPLADAASAAQLATRALDAAPASITAGLALHDASPGAAPERAWGALATASGETLGGALFARARARAREREGKRADLAGDDVEAILVRARSAAADGAAAPLAEALAQLAQRPIATDVADAARRGSALAQARTGDGRAALARVGAFEGASVSTLRTAARLAARVGDRERELAALRAWAAATSGSDRATALARLADLAIEAGDLDAAEASLRDASLADASLGTLRIVRDRIVRKDPARAGRSDGSEGALALAAKVAIDVDDAGREIELLGRARAEEDAPVTADVLSLDAALLAENGGLAQVDPAPVDQGLLREVERTPADARTPPLLALADRYGQRNDFAAREQALRDARSLSPGEAIVVRPLAQLLAGRSPREAAALWLEEASAAPDARAAFAASMAGRLLEGDAAVMAHRRALDAQRTHAPSIEALERHARQTGDVKLLEDALDRGLALPTVDLDRAAQLVRLALVRSEDAAAAARTFEQARALVPSDPVLADLALRLADALTPSQRAELAERAAASAPPVLVPAYRLAHAAALEDAGQAAEAAAVVRELLEVPGAVGRAARRALDRLEIAQGDVTRVAERRFAALREAPENDEVSRVRALEELAALDLEVRKDVSSAAASLSGIVELRPKHLFALRTLERHAMESDRGLDLAALCEQILKADLAPEDAAAHLRLVVRLRLAPADARGDAADEAVLAARAHVGDDPWTLRRVITAAHAKQDPNVALEAERALAERLAGAIERGTLALRASHSLARAQIGVPTASARGAELLAPFAAAAPGHGPLWEELADLHESAGAHAAAVDALEAAAAAAMVPARKVALLHRGAVIATDRADDDERALALLDAASQIDVAYADVFERMRTILEQKGDRARLSELVRRRAAAGGDGAMLVELHLAEAGLREAEGDSEGAKNALKAALALAPEKLEALRKLAQLCLAGEDYRTAADALIRIARIRKDREELRWVFFTLGDIYDKHIPDPKRAEAAFLRVLKLEPEDLASMERLAELYQREKQAPQAAEMLERLAKTEVDPDRVRKHQLALANVLETGGDARKAEQVLETARRAAPTELETLRALADFYGRQRAQTAHAMHLNRAVVDFRHALMTDLSDTQAWLGLVEVLGWRGKRDAAKAAASLAMGLGVVDVELARLLDASGGAPGAGLRGADPDLDDLLAPPTLTAPTRAVFRLLGAALEKVLPFDPRTLRAEKLGPKDTALRPIAMEIAQWMQLPDVEIWLAPTAGRVCMPVSSQPVALVVGRDLLAADERERTFLLARALRIAKSQLTLAMRAQPAELAALLAGLVLNFDPHYQLPMGVDAATAQDFMRRVARQLPRRAQEEIGPVVFEMAGAPEYDPPKLPLAVSELGDRAALLMTGNAPAAVSALAKLAGDASFPADPAGRIAVVRRSAESTSLVSFALSDAHFEARHRAGLS
ncbi:MAG: hypothetical protein U0234_13595 [Sandaracinus sp.]